MKKIKKVDGFGQKELSSAVEEFLRHCRLKNLSPRTIEYYAENLRYFRRISPVQYVEDITRLVVEDFVDHEMTKGNSTSAVNTRIRGLRVFLNFCADREYMKKLSFPLIKEDEHLKEPYTDAELQRLLKKPTSERWGEWRTWTAINMFLATGIRANTLVNIKICEVDFEHDTIFLRKLKNRKQQIIPMSKALKDVLVLYLKLWDWDSEFYLFPTMSGKQLSVHALEDSVRHYNIARNVSKTSLHLFRHTFAKNYILAGGGLVQLQMILGHSTLDMTRRYINLYGSDVHRDFDKLNPLNNIITKLPEN